jgi:hypothetical protein
MDGKGTWRDHVFVERVCKMIKYKEGSLHAYDNVFVEGRACSIRSLLQLARAPSRVWRLHVRCRVIRFVASTADGVARRVALNLR